MVVSCAHVQPPSPTLAVAPAQHPKYDPEAISYWHGDSLSGSPKIKIDLGEQKAYFYKGGQLAGVSAVSTGRPGLATETGTFHVMEKERNHRSSIYGDYVDGSGNIVKAEVDINKDRQPRGTHFVGSPMPNFMRVVGGIGMHEGYLPGYPASHGCIRMPASMAEEFYDNAQVGTPVTIVQ